MPLVARLDLDEVTRREGFTRLVKEGRSPGDIALTFGLTELQVKPTLALCNLLPRNRIMLSDECPSSLPIRRRNDMSGSIPPRLGACFPGSHRQVCCPRALGRIALGDAQAAALAVLVPLLGCGEEAAALAFDGLAGLERDPVAAAALRAIGAEEREHDALLTSLAAALPATEAATALQLAARRFHIRLGVGRPAAHLGRIAAIDAAVCSVLSRLLRPGNPLSNDPATAVLFARIRRDEARHVRVSRELASGRLARPELNDLAFAARSALADVLMLAGAAFETLGVDPQRLHRDLARVPDGLFA